MHIVRHCCDRDDVRYEMWNTSCYCCRTLLTGESYSGRAVEHFRTAGPQSMVSGSSLVDDSAVLLLYSSKRYFLAGVSR